MNVNDSWSYQRQVTTDPVNHSGQGIFFTSRLLDSFDILSGGLFFTHSLKRDEDWLLERPQFQGGTTIFMKLNNNKDRVDEKVFKQFSSEDGYSFAKTIVPVKLARYGEEKLVARSQAKQLLAGVDRFQTVIFDFSEIDTIGQAFADEIFRVFARSHPEMKIVAINENERIAQIIAAAESEWASPNLT